MTELGHMNYLFSYFIFRRLYSVCDVAGVHVAYGSNISCSMASTREKRSPSAIGVLYMVYLLACYLLFVIEVLFKTISYDSVQK